MKGITPIIAVILLLLMTVAAGAATMFWFSKLQSAIQTQTETQVSQMIGQMSMQIKILSATNQSTNLILSLSNIGTVPIDLSKAIVTVDEQDINTGTIKRVYSGPCLSGTLGVGQVDVNLQCNCNCINHTYAEGYQYIITVTLPNGFTDTYTLRP